MGMRQGVKASNPEGLQQQQHATCAGLTGLMLAIKTAPVQLLHCRSPSQTLTTEVKHLLGLLDPANHAESSNKSIVTSWQVVLVELCESCCGKRACNWHYQK